MKKTYINYAIPLTLISLALLIGVLHHVPKTPHNKSNRPLSIVCTTSILADTLQQIVGPHATVKALMGPGVDPHTYRARESDVHALANADIIFYNGLHLEGKMADILHGMRAYATTIAVADCLPTHELIASDEFENLYDPHIWFCVPIWIQVCNYIRDTLNAQDPEHAQEYTRNANAYINTLEELHATLTQTAHTIPQEKRILVTAHDAFSYFGKTYGFRVVGLQGINTDAQAGTRDIQDLADFIIRHQIPTIFVESSIPQRTIHAVQQSTQARGVPVAIGPELYSDALGSPDSAAATYCDMVRYNMTTIVNALAQ
jgi:manganese/zinc/iron transport system substrate-binding protein